MVFGFLVMETVPGGAGICVLDTDLEVDFAPPVGYVEPERPKAPPPSTMASKLNIDLNSSSPGSSRPSSSLAGGFVTGGTSTVSKGGDHWESFKGKGETLSGRKTKGKGISYRGVEQVAEGSKIIRSEYVFISIKMITLFICSRRKVVTSDSLESEAKVPSALNIPFGKLFFGFKTVPYTPSEPTAQSPSGSSGQPVSVLSTLTRHHSHMSSIGHVLWVWKYAQRTIRSDELTQPVCKRKGKGQVTDTF